MKDIMLDLVTSTLQVWLFFIIISSCIKKNKLNTKNNIKIIICLWICTVLFTYIFGNLSICVFLTHIASLALIALLYKENKLEAIVAYTIAYIGFAVYSIFLGNFFLGCINPFIPKEHKFLSKIIIMYVPQYILIILTVLNKEKAVAVYKVLMSEKYTIKTIVIISFVLDFVISFYMNIYGTEIAILKNLIIIICALFFVAITIHFKNIEKKSHQILLLNNSLEIKNNELRKVKHDYGAQISYLYGLHLMKRYDDLGKALKDIIEKNDAINCGAEVVYNKNSFLSVALQPAIEKGIHVIIDENSKVDLSYINEIDLYAILSNIISNAIRAMNGQGLIVAETYDTLKSTIIKIENNGPKIPGKYLEDIFKEGFTTKDNADKSHGYGLSIVKELVEKYNGKVNVRSSNESTEFKIIFPI